MCCIIKSVSFIQHLLQNLFCESSKNSSTEKVLKIHAFLYHGQDLFYIITVIFRKDLPLLILYIIVLIVSRITKVIVPVWSAWKIFNRNFNPFIHGVINFLFRFFLGHFLRRNFFFGCFIRFFFPCHFIRLLFLCRICGIRICFFCIWILHIITSLPLIINRIRLILVRFITSWCFSLSLRSCGDTFIRYCGIGFFIIILGLIFPIARGRGFWLCFQSLGYRRCQRCDRGRWKCRNYHRDR